MKDEERSVIRLLNSTLQNGITFYHFHITHRSQIYSLTCRYSKLRSISTLLPPAQIKFPGPCHLSMLVSTLFGDKSLLDERYQKLTKYFEELSKLAQLAQNKGFKRLLQESDLVEQQKEKSMPQAPRLCGRKLTHREFTEQLLIIVG